MPYFTSCPVLNNSVSSVLAQFSVVYKWSLLKCAFIWKKWVLFEVTWSPAVHICWCTISGQIGVFTDNPWECCLVIYCALAHLNSKKRKKLHRRKGRQKLCEERHAWRESMRFVNCMIPMLNAELQPCSLCCQILTVNVPASTTGIDTVS